MEVIRKSFSAETKALDESRGLVEAIVNVGAVLDRQDDVMEPGCWGAVIKAARAGETSWPAICWGHKNGMGTDLVVVGKVLEAEEIPPGNSRLPASVQKAGGSALRIVGQYNMETQVGREAFSNVKGGYVTQWSVGFEPDPARLRFEKGVRFVGPDGVKTWPEVSNVLLGASPGTHTTATKSDEERPMVTERQLRSAERLGEALDLLAACKADQSTEDARSDAKHKMRGTDGKVKFPIDDCKDVADAWGLRGHADNVEGGQAAVERHIRRAAAAENCDGPWNDGGKADDLHLEQKDGKPPELQGDEAPHNAPLQAAMDAVKTLIGQELAEDYPEPDCVMRLTCIWQDLLSWAQGEATEYTDYGSLPMQMTDYLRAGIAKLAVPAPPVEKEAEPQPEPAEEPVVPFDEWPDWLRAAAESYTAAPEPTSQQSVDEPIGNWEQHVPNAVRFRHGRTPWMTELEPQQ